MDTLRAMAARGTQQGQTMNQFRTYQNQQQQSFKLRNSVGFTPQTNPGSQHQAAQKFSNHSNNNSGYSFGQDPFANQPQQYNKKGASFVQKMLPHQHTNGKILGSHIDKNMNVRQMIDLFQARSSNNNSQVQSSLGAQYGNPGSMLGGERKTNSQRRYHEIEKLLSQFNNDDKSTYIQNHLNPGVQNQLRLLRFNTGDRPSDTFANHQYSHPESYKRGFSHQLRQLDHSDPRMSQQMGMPQKLIGQGIQGQSQTPQNRTLVLKGDQLFLVQNNVIQPAFILNQATNQLVIPSEHLSLLQKQRVGGYPQMILIDPKTSRGEKVKDLENLKSCSMQKPVQSSHNFPQPSSRPKQTIDVTSGKENSLGIPAVAIDTESRSAGSELSQEDLLDEEDLEYGSEEDDEEDDSSIDSNHRSMNDAKQSPEKANEDKKMEKPKRKLRTFPKLVSNSEKFNMNLLRSKSAPQSQLLMQQGSNLFSEANRQPRRKKVVPPSKFLCNLSADFINFCPERKSRFYRRARGQQLGYKKKVKGPNCSKPAAKQKSSKHMLAIKGNFAGNPYKIFKNSKFINNTEKINHKLHSSVQHVLKKDNQAYGTYSINPFAYYPKNIKNTVMNLMTRHTHELEAGANLCRDKKYDLPFLSTQVLQGQEECIKFDNAFIDFAQKQKDHQNGKAMDVKFAQIIEQNQKKRYLASTPLSKSFHVKHVFDIWIKLHSAQKYDYIQHFLQQKLQVQLQKAIQNSIHGPGSSYGPYQVEYYVQCLKSFHRQFIIRNQQIVREMNVKYVHPITDPKYFCYIHKKPNLIKKVTKNNASEDGESPLIKAASTKKVPTKMAVDLDSESGNENVNSVQDLLSCAKNISPLKDSTAELAKKEDQVEKLTKKEQIQKLEEGKKRALFRYKRWKFSLKNEKNVNFLSEQLPVLFHRHNLEYQICYTLSGNASGCLEGKKKPPLSRVQSAKSGSMYYKNMNTCNSRALIMMNGDQGSSFKNTRPTSKYKSRTDLLRNQGNSESKKQQLTKNSSQAILKQKRKDPLFSKQTGQQIGMVQNGCYIQFTNNSQVAEDVAHQRELILAAVPQSPLIAELAKQSRHQMDSSTRGKSPNLEKDEPVSSRATDSIIKFQDQQAKANNFSDYVKSQKAAYGKQRGVS